MSIATDKRAFLFLVALACLLIAAVSAQQPTLAANAAVSPVLEADLFCASPGVFDESCLVRAVSKAVPGTTIQLGPHVYTISAPVLFLDVHGLHFRGAGDATVLTGKNLAVFSCRSCSQIEVDHLRLASMVKPVLVRTADLPTRDPAQLIAIDRFNSGHAYLPRENDADITPSSSGGQCRSHCLSEAQTRESIDVTLAFYLSDHLWLHDLSSSFGALSFEDVHSVIVASNRLSGSNTRGGCIGFQRASLSSLGNHAVMLINNRLSDCTYNGISMTGDDFVVLDNVASYNGESGIKTAQGEGITATHVVILNNVADHNWYDGFDFGTSFPHNSMRDNFHILVGNVSHDNRETGYTGDGHFVTFASNVAHGNFNDGALLDLCDSTVTGNVMLGNNRGDNQEAVHQMLLDWASGKACAGGSRNIVAGNHTSTEGHPGNGLWDGGLLNTFIGNEELTGTHYWGDVKATQSLRFGNSDRSGPVLDLLHIH